MNFSYVLAPKGQTYHIIRLMYNFQQKLNPRVEIWLVALSFKNDDQRTSRSGSLVVSSVVCRWRNKYIHMKFLHLAYQHFEKEIKLPASHQKPLLDIKKIINHCLLRVSELRPWLAQLFSDIYVCNNWSASWSMWIRLWERLNQQFDWLFVN